MDVRVHESQVFMLRVWQGPAAFRAAVRRVGEDEWTSLTTPVALADYLRNAVPVNSAATLADSAHDGAVFAPSLEVFTLGRFSPLLNDCPLPVAAKAQKKTLDLLKALIAFGSRQVCQARLADALWPDAEADCARQNLKATLHRLRKLIGHASVMVHDGRLSLNAECCRVDLWECERLLDQALSLQPSADVQEPARLLDEALVLYRGPFLDGVDAGYALAPREKLRAKLLRATTHAVQHLLAQGARERCITLIERGLEIDPLQEPLYQMLMRAYGDSGRQADALVTYRRCCAQLQAALGVRPAAATEALRRSVCSVAA
jgi:DNA-binding SARP family transcriptional activator